MTVGYSGTPLAKKLGIKEGMTVVTVDPPDDYRGLVDPLPENVVLEEGTLATARVSALEADILHIFTNTRDGLFRGLADARTLIKQNGTIWVSWYKKASKLPSEITEDTVREAAFPLGLVDVKVCAIDEKWSGLKLVIRRENRI